jgi:transposase-like protein
MLYKRAALHAVPSLYALQSGVKSFRRTSVQLPSSTSQHQLQRVVTMPLQRRFGQELDQNVRRSRNISPATRNQAIGMLKSGMTVLEVARAIQRGERTIRDLRAKYRQTGSVQDKPRSGRPPVLSKQQKKIIYRRCGQLQR